MHGLGNRPTDADMQEAGRFAIQLRLLIRSPEGWARVMACARTLLHESGVRGWPKREDPLHEMSTIAFAIVAARRCSRQLPKTDPARIECDALIDKLVSLAWA